MLSFPPVITHTRGNIMPGQNRAKGPAVAIDDVSPTQVLLATTKSQVGFSWLPEPCEWLVLINQRKRKA